MEDLAASLMSLSRSAPLYLFYNVSGFPKHHEEQEFRGGGGGFEFATTAKNDVDGDGRDSAAEPRACSSDVSAFANELFGDVLLPLKLPPRLQRPSSSAAASAATSPTSALARVPSRSPFASRRRQRGFDPFAAALEKVRRDGAAPAPLRRAWSLSPSRGPDAGLNSSRAGAAAAAQKASVAARQAWPRRRGLRHLLCRAVMTSAAVRPSRRDGGVPYRPGLLACFRC